MTITRSITHLPGVAGWPLTLGQLFRDRYWTARRRSSLRALVGKVALVVAAAIGLVVFSVGIHVRRRNAGGG